MGIIELLNTVVLVIGISFGLMLVCQTFMRVRGEEYRKNEKFATEMCERMFKGIKELAIDTFKELKKLDKDDEPVTYSGPTKFEDVIKKKIDDEWKE